MSMLAVRLLTLATDHCIVTLGVIFNVQMLTAVSAYRGHCKSIIPTGTDFLFICLYVMFKLQNHLYIQ